ncbi:MAG: hypothetical protein PHG15_03875 [Acinetobacter sp.]|uniref:hypothetical protein n=1 Tax=Acinetobacter sp. TaxID=472 RepID=UPI00261C008C|nr:hypothetical protein [Acinetobacter sp.]MDD2944951.1 hypothetical protein [Acinetobacter sp.]
MNALRQDLTVTSGNDLLIGLNNKTSNALVPAGVKFERGDLVDVDETTNELSHVASATSFCAIMTLDITAAQATSHNSKGIEVPIYTQGTFDPFECKVNGTKLDKAGRLLARAYANKNLPGVELHMPHGVADV